MPALLQLNEHPDIFQGIRNVFKGISWMAHRDATNDNPQLYIRREWGCKLSMHSPPFLEFDCDVDMVEFILKRPWESTF